ARSTSSILRFARSGSTWTCRSYAPRTRSRARSVGCKQRFLFWDGRRALDVERWHGLHAPSLPFRALRLRPDHRLVVGRVDQVAARGDLDPVAAGLPRVEEERLLDRVLVRARLHHDPVLEEDVGRAEDVLALVDEKCDVMQATTAARRIARVRHVVRLLIRREPHAGLAAVVEHDLLGEAQAEILFAEDARLRWIKGEQVDVV